MRKIEIEKAENYGYILKSDMHSTIHESIEDAFKAIRIAFGEPENKKERN